MTTFMEQSDRIRVAVSEELERFRRTLENVGISWSEPEIVVLNSSPNRYTAELKVDFYQDAILVDVFEFFVCNEGVVSVSENEVRQWIQDNIPDVVRRRVKT